MIQNKSINLVLALSAIALPIASRAQVVGGINNPGGQIVNLPGGNMSWEQYSKTPVYMQMMDTLRQRSAQAAALYQESVKGFMSAFSELQNFAGTNLMDPAIISITDSASAVPIKTYALNLQRYSELRRTVELQILSIESFPSSLQGRIDTDAPSSGVNSIPTITAGLNFTAVAAGFKAKLKAVDDSLMAQEIMIATKNRGVVASKLLDRSVIKLDYDKKDFDQMAADIKKARHMSDSDRNVLSAYTRKLEEQILVVINTFGKTERWRPLQHDDEQRARRDRATIKDMADAFQQRDYIRMRYGVNLGMIGIKYDTKAFGLDRFFTNLNKITFQPVGLDSSYYSAREKEIAELIKTSGSKGQEFSKILKGEVGVLKSANSVVAFVMGQDQTAQALLPIVGMILSDMYNENLVLQGKRNELIARYKAQYYDTTKPNNKNEKGYSDREVALMRELEFDYSDKRMSDLMEKKAIPESVTRINNSDEDSLFGRGQDSLRIVKIKAIDYAKAAAIQQTIDSYLESLNPPTSEAANIDDKLGL